MSASATRRQTLARQVETIRGRLSAFEMIDHETITGDIPAVVRERLSGERFRTRLALRHVRKRGGLQIASAGKDQDRLTAAGGKAIEDLVARVGVHVLWRDVLRVVHRSDLTVLERAFGFEPRDVACRGRDNDIAISFLTPLDDGAAEALADAAMAEGAYSWACWIVAQDEALRRHLRVLTPRRITSLIPKALSQDAEERARRRSVVRVEMHAMFADSDVETRSEVAR